MKLTSRKWRNKVYRKSTNLGFTLACYFLHNMVLFNNAYFVFCIWQVPGVLFMGWSHWRSDIGFCSASVHQMEKPRNHCLDSHRFGWQRLVFLIVESAYQWNLFCIRHMDMCLHQKPLWLWVEIIVTTANKFNYFRILTLSPFTSIQCFQ